MSLPEEYDKAPEAQKHELAKGWGDSGSLLFFEALRAKRPIHSIAWGDET